MKRVLITGAGGQDGHYLAAACRQRGWDVTAFGRAALDVRDAEAVSAAVRRIQPQMIFNLAAVSSVKPECARQHHDIIGGGTLNLLEAVRRHYPDARTFLCGSAYQLSEFPGSGFRVSGLEPRNPQLETRNPELAPPSFQNEYAAARNYSRDLARCFRTRDGLNVKFGILFHHESPLRDARFVSRQIADGAMAGVPVEVRDASVEKEWTFAGDMAEAMILLLEQDEVQEACLGTGDARPIADWAEACYGLHGLDFRKFLTSTEPPSHSRLAADGRRMAALGWQPKVSLPDLARMMAVT